MTTFLSLILLALIVLLFTSLTQGFVPRNLKRSSTSALHVAQDNQPKYKELLEKAKQAKEGKRGASERAADGPGKKTTSPPPGTGKFSARDMASFKNKVPFSEDIYETIKFTIQTLSNRMKDKQPVTPEVLAKLEDAVEIILQDARQPPPPSSSN